MTSTYSAGISGDVLAYKERLQHVGEVPDKVNIKKKFFKESSKKFSACVVLNFLKGNRRMFGSKN